MKHFAISFGDGFQVFGKKNPNGNAENDVSMTRYTLQHFRTKLAPSQFRRHFPVFRRTESFFRTFSNASQAFLPVALNPPQSHGLRIDFLICAPRKIPSLTLASFILGNFCLK
jgi:hypothetical protein